MIWTVLLWEGLGPSHMRQTVCIIMIDLHLSWVTTQGRVGVCRGALMVKKQTCRGGCWLPPRFEVVAILVLMTMSPCMTASTMDRALIIVIVQAFLFLVFLFSHTIEPTWWALIVQWQWWAWWVSLGVLIVFFFVCLSYLLMMSISFVLVAACRFVKFHFDAVARLCPELMKLVCHCTGIEW